MRFANALEIEVKARGLMPRGAHGRAKLQRHFERRAGRQGVDTIERRARFRVAAARLGGRRMSTSDLLSDRNDIARAVSEFGGGGNQRGWLAAYDSMINRRRKLR